MTWFFRRSWTGVVDAAYNVGHHLLMFIISLTGSICELNETTVSLLSIEFMLVISVSVSSEFTIPFNPMFFKHVSRMLNSLNWGVLFFLLSKGSWNTCVLNLANNKINKIEARIFREPPCVAVHWTYVSIQTNIVIQCLLFLRPLLMNLYGSLQFSRPHSKKAFHHIRETDSQGLSHKARRIHTPWYSYYNMLESTVNNLLPISIAMLRAVVVLILPFCMWSATIRSIFSPNPSPPAPSPFTWTNITLAHPASSTHHQQISSHVSPLPTNKIEMK